MEVLTRFLPKTFKSNSTTSGQTAKASKRKQLDPYKITCGQSTWNF